ncbi:hypothetical protein [Lactococcus lactis]|uniref:hypothetical protein n=1 Tax=Lactococcus lactis TaxID=1358 RepID=UPI0021094C14|nr:hypothetical protein [Lactococcus lactis]MCQ4972476.1 hypothetical protein [Lactococcus lactis]MCQ4998282.1 hypothetical protein [Lactococcus lactis]
MILNLLDITLITDLINFLFINEHNKLNWTSISLIISGSFLLISFFANRKREKYFFEEAASTEKKLLEKSLELQQKISDEKIHADIISQARIKWIQDVRETTSNVFSLYYQCCTVEDKNLRTELSGKYSAEVLKLRLFFATLEYQDEKNINFNQISSHDEPDKYLKDIQTNYPDDPSSKALKLLKNLDSNEGKNIYMVELINELERQRAFTNKKYMSSLFSELVVAVSIYLKIDWEQSKKIN